MDVFDSNRVVALRIADKYEEAHTYCMNHFSDPDAIAEIGFDYRHGLGVGEDKKRGFYFDKLAADRGSVRGLFQLAEDYYYGYGIEMSMEESLQESIWRFEKAAELGSSDAKLVLGQAILYGIIGRDEKGHRNFARACRYFKECSDSGDLRGTSFLALCYVNGLGCEKEPTKATTLLDKVYRSKNGRALYLVGQGYTHESWGFHRNDNEARRWYRQAAIAGYTPAIDALKRRYNATLSELHEIDIERQRLFKTVTDGVPTGEISVNGG